MARDNFSQLVKTKLGRRVNYRCSNPDCRVPTLAPKTETDDANNIGIAAHICAASIGGPRYDPSMSQKERGAIHNGIWLCCNCATKIDRDDQKYTVDILKGWKQTAENLAQQEQGTKLPSASDATDLLSVSLGANPKRLIPQAIGTIHRATNQALEQLDPRFKINSSYIDGNTHFEIRAKEPTNIKFHIKSDGTTNYSGMLHSLLEKGGDLELPTECLSVSGSKLFEEILSEKGKLKIKSASKKATIKLFALSHDQSTKSNIDDMIGDLSYGSKEFSFKGYCCNNILGVSFSRGFDSSGSALPLSLTLNFTLWDKKLITQLPYFESIYSFFSTLFNNGVMCIKMEIEGIEVSSGKVHDLSKEDFIVNTYLFLRYTKAAQAISSYTHTQLYFDSIIKFSGDELDRMIEIESIINNKHTYTANDIKSKMTCSLSPVSKDLIKRLKNNSNPGNISMTSDQKESINVFNKDISLPSRIIEISQVLIKPLGKIKNNNEAEFELVPSNGFLYKVSFDKLANDRN